LVQATLLLNSVPSQAPDLARDSNRAVAVVGIACRFPRASDPEALWHALRAGTDAISEVPKERFSLGAHFDPDPDARGKIRSRYGGFIGEVDRFDAEFFHISPREARQIDPQQRTMLELSWEALEDAAIAPDALAGTKTGVFFGAMWGDYETLLHDRGAEIIGRHAATGTSRSLISNRVSHALGLRGPSITLDTASSSSLVAVHLARQSLELGESTLALAGGVNLILAPQSSVQISKMGATAPDGRSKAFDANADGYVRADGAGVVVLKPLAGAIEDGDPIYCVLLGSAVNNDGATEALSVPSQAAQEDLLSTAYASARVDPRSIDYVEAHGTGTAVGDPIEARALGNVLGKGRAPSRPLLIGSVKTNLGHAEAAAGIAGLIKVALSMRHREIPRTLNFERPNPTIDFGALGLRVETNHRPWPENHDGRRALAGVSSFGFGGTNAHVVVEGPPRPVARPNAERSSELVVLSAHSAEALKALAARVAERIESDRPSLQDLAYTSIVRRAHHEHRLAFVADSSEAARRVLLAFAQGEGTGDLRSGRRSPSSAPEIAFVFPGAEGELGAARELFEGDPSFRRALLDCSRIAEMVIGAPITDHLHGDAGAHRRPEAMTRAMTLALELSLSALWRARGIVPAACTGFGVGALAARVDSGAMDLSTAFARLAQEGAGEIDAPPAPIASGVHRWLVMGSVAAGPSVLAALAPNGREIIFSLDRAKGSARSILIATSALYAGGSAIDGRALHPDGGGIARFPRYPFQRKRYWWPRADEAVDGPTRADVSSRSAGADPIGLRALELRWIEAPLRSVSASNRRLEFVLVGGGGFGAELREALVAEGHRVLDAEPSSRLDPFGPRVRLVHLAGLEVSSPFEDLDRALADKARAESSLIELAERSAGPRPPIWVVTRSSQAAGEGPSSVAIAQASLWGLGQKLAAKMIDLDPGTTPDAVKQLARELCSEGSDDRVAFREGARRVGRLVPRRAALSCDSPSDTAEVELKIPTPGILDDLVFERAERIVPGPTEIEIDVVAAGLNFRDVLQALGLYPGDPFPLGGECAGVVSRVGSRVSGLEVGDEVFALFGKTAMFRRFALVDARFATKKPEDLGFEAAAASPVVFLTAIHALHHLGRMKKGERILIHAAAGGVGLAAVQLAHRTGLEIFGTAGDARKRDLLLSLGVDHVMSSRTAAFAEEIAAVTQGRGVDLVLNCLAGELIEKSLSVLARGGRFLEMGKNGIWTQDQVRRFRPDVSYAAFDLQAVARERPEHIEALLRGLARDLDRGFLRPAPLRVFALVDAKRAFRHMAKAKHVGKIALSVKPSGAPRRRPRIRSQASYLVLGELDRLGAAAVGALLERGVERVVIAAERAPDTYGAGVTFEPVDATHEHELDRLIRKIDRAGPPLRGVVVSLEGKNDDLRLALVAHVATRKLPLDVFAMLTSADDGTGAFLAALAHHRQASGLCGASIRLTSRGTSMSAVELARLLEDDITDIILGAPLEPSGSLLRERLEACPALERGPLIVGCVATEVRRVLELEDTSRLALDARFVDAGMDSKMIEELARSLSVALGAVVRLSTVYGCATIERLAEHLSEAIFGPNPAAHSARSPEPDEAAILERIEGLSEEAAEALMIEKLVELEHLISE
jgi:NADPH:quinone reductase-like Zn-dependent oxidoreductase/3-oxoacyl-(acyl-carrier-protein) synthase